MTYFSLGLGVLIKIETVLEPEIHPMNWTFVVGLENLDKHKFVRHREIPIQFPRDSWGNYKAWNIIINNSFRYEKTKLRQANFMTEKG